MFVHDVFVRALGRILQPGMVRAYADDTAAVLDNLERQAPLVELGLDSLDQVNLRTAFQKRFKCVVPLSTFTYANETLEHLAAKLCERLLA